MDTAKPKLVKFTPESVNQQQMETATFEYDDDDQCPLDMYLRE